MPQCGNVFHHQPLEWPESVDEIRTDVQTTGSVVQRGPVEIQTLRRNVIILNNLSVIGLGQDRTASGDAFWSFSFIHEVELDDWITHQTLRNQTAVPSHFQLIFSFFLNHNHSLTLITCFCIVTMNITMLFLCLNIISQCCSENLQTHRGCFNPKAPKQWTMCHDAITNWDLFPAGFKRFILVETIELPQIQT